MDLQTLKQRFGIIGNSPGLEHALQVAVRVAPTDLSVLIMGESGVGKEVFSQIIHALSTRKHHSFIAVNCGAIPEGTIDSELFGHEKGSFTGASDSRKGYFEVVDGGTIFLDEIGEMPLSTQARLLRVLESGEFIRVGSSKTQRTDVRVIAATNVNLSEAVKHNKFREDLYYRLNTVPISIPALRERKEDVYLLFRKFSTDFAEKNRIAPVILSQDARDLLLAYQWPGNIRELKNIAEQISVLSVDRQVDASILRRFVPQLAKTNHTLPVLSEHTQRDQYQHRNDYSERDLLYRLLFDMRQEMHDLKQLLLQLLGSTAINPTGYPPNAIVKSDLTVSNATTSYDNRAMPVFINSNPSDSGLSTHRRVAADEYNNVEIIDESLSLDEKEKEMIIRALSKHKGRRKEAASDLGISERTLYRKIRDYDIKE